SIGKQLEILEHYAQFSPQKGNVVFLEGFQVKTDDLSRTLPQGKVGVEGLHKTALAASGFSNNVDKFPFLHLQVKMVENKVFFLENGDILYIDNGLGHFATFVD